ncbi:DNA-directed RNA polymerase subunit RPC12/RpoP [Anaerotaenia torta]
MTDIIIWSLVAGVIVCGLLLHIYVWKYYHYICPRCSCPFKPTFFRSLIAVNAAEHRKMKCPHCHLEGYMEAVKDKPKGRK